MTRNKALQVVKALTDIEDFELFMEQVELIYHSTEANLEDFFENELMPLMKAELANRKAILDQM